MREDPGSLEDLVHPKSRLPSVKTAAAAILSMPSKRATAYEDRWRKSAAYAGRSWPLSCIAVAAASRCTSPVRTAAELLHCPQKSKSQLRGTSDPSPYSLIIACISVMIAGAASTEMSREVD
jgi:hypothetical protein